MIALTVVLAVVVGLSLGLLGGGGSILTVPLLAYVAGMDAKQAIAVAVKQINATAGHQIAKLVGSEGGHW